MPALMPSHHNAVDPDRGSIIDGAEIQPDAPVRPFRGDLEWRADTRRRDGRKGLRSR